MANRHLSRSIVMQSLYEWDFRGGNLTELDLEKTLTRLAEEFAPGIQDLSFMRKLLLGVLGKQKELDVIIEKAAPDWPIDKIAIVDRNILRLGLFELLFEDRAQVPAKVAINEAIELAKTFGGETSGKFVNGVLGAVYKELGEPGKDEVSKKKKVGTPIDPKTLPLEKLGGSVVYAKNGEEIYLALVHDIFGHWTLSKGHFAEGEDDQTAIVRVVNEELGLPVVVGEILGENEYTASHPEKGKIRKHVSYYLAEAPFQNITVEKTGGLDDARWWKLADIVSLNLYDDMIPVITKAVGILLGK
ncbi:MAG: N utilization substance protein B-like protein [Parcubacteria group bacterium GW2011_GWA1_47_8]|nr:MAG: N utilization substance protein B-like protein [Parcubacteria group bacterium GW2011_GWA1_47_8]KKW07113.1 MAG: N utilization substance protein B-like protein [Parcubacteria group bacterium GW2011_GWA2_49_16]